MRILSVEIEGNTSSMKDLRYWANLSTSGKIGQHFGEIRQTLGHFWAKLICICQICGNKIADVKKSENVWIGAVQKCVHFLQAARKMLPI